MHNGRKNTENGEPRTFGNVYERGICERRASNMSVGELLFSFSYNNEELSMAVFVKMQKVITHNHSDSCSRYFSDYSVIHVHF